VKRLSSYQEVGQHAFGRTGLIAVWFFYGTTVIGVPVMFLILAETGLKNVVDADIGTKTWIWICAALVAIPFLSMKTMKDVALTSTFGALATVVMVVVAVRGSILDIHNPVYEDVKHSFVILAHLPSAVATISMCFGGNVIYIHVEESMRYPKSWNRVVAAALGTCSIFYLVTAVVGYLAYGDLAESPIFNNLPQDTFTKIGTVVIVFYVLLTAPMLLTSLALEIERQASITIESRGKVMERIYRTALRTAIIGVCGFIACTVPYFGDFWSLLGALSNCTLIFVLPTLCYAKLIGLRHMPWYESVWCAVIVAVGIVCAVIGSIDAAKALKRDFENDPS
jgi:amino acid permease